MQMWIKGIMRFLLMVSTEIMVVTPAALGGGGPVGAGAGGLPARSKAKASNSFLPVVVTGAGNGTPESPHNS